jgi:hypothetical protein
MLCIKTLRSTPEITMKTIPCVCIIALVCSASLSANPIGLFNTGVDSSGTALAGGSADPHYTVLISGNPNAVVTSDSVAGSWLPNTPDSKWIWQQSNGQPTYVARIFRTTFDLTGLDLDSAVISGRWSTDNFGLDLIINGISTGQTSGTYVSWSNFSIGSTDLVQGTNTLDFVVQDAGVIAGFRAEFLEASADVSRLSTVPESGSALILLCMGILAAWGAGRKHGFRQI